MVKDSLFLHSVQLYLSNKLLNHDDKDETKVHCENKDYQVHDYVAKFLDPRLIVDKATQQNKVVLNHDKYALVEDLKRLCGR